VESDAHKFLKRKRAKPRIGEVNELVAAILNHYTQQDFTVSKYIKMGTFELRLKGTSRTSIGRFRFETLAQHIQEDRSFQYEKFGLPPLYSHWLDAEPIFSLNAPIKATDVEGPLKFLVVPYGDSFPVKPCLDREGVAFGNFQTPVQQNIVRMYNKIIDESHLALEIDSPVWFHDLRMLINDCVTIVDITLHQLICKAEYDPKPDWKFESKWVKNRRRMGLMAKFQWIEQITGQKFDNEESDDTQKGETYFEFLKSIRNHFNHFYPPCIVFTLEETCEWLNRIPDIGRLLWRMREKMGEPVSKGIVEMITLPLVEFVPRDPTAPRLPQSDEVGYKTSTGQAH